MNYMTLGVIGHVDHGKTSLVKALTGTDTDRLKEEKERGISIALGYAYLDVPDGKLGIVDAPGHEKFIRTMISGATGIRAVLLVLDVNEGVKPQTIEHIRIAELLGIEHGVIVITKCDTADEDMRELAALDIQEFLEGTFLQDAPIIHTSSQTGEGLDSLKQTLNQLLTNVKPLPDNRLPYLPVDRVFSLPGFGTIVTGTLRRGTITVDDDILLHPAGEAVRIRELQNHGEHVDTVRPGMRCAVNIRAANKILIKRGDALAPQDTLMSGTFATAALTLLPADPKITLKQRQQVRLLWGTNEVVARVHILGAESIVSGETMTVQLQFEASVCSMFREKAIIRSYSPIQTIGGATLLEFTEKRYKRKDQNAHDHAEILCTGTPEQVLNEALLTCPTGILSTSIAVTRYGLNDKQAKAAWKSVGAKTLDKNWQTHPDRITLTQQQILDHLKTFHELNPTQWGPSPEQLQTLLNTTTADRLITYTINTLLHKETITNTQGSLHLSDHRAGGTLNDEENALVDEIENAFKSGGLQPPGVVEVLRDDKERIRLYRYLIDQGTLQATTVANKPKTLSNTIVFHKQTIEAAVKSLRAAIPPETPFTPADAKEHIQTTRKYLIPLLECLDKQGVTKRKGEGRVLVQ
ncbi:selenocysteine-specific translation elongation factor [bacterium AH-315-P07]|nr:selenocysteine-specific translation elongation factor [bacterium AH-315-P07]